MALPKKNSILKGVEVIDTGVKGKSIGKWNSAVIFIKDTVPGDVVDIKVTGRRRKFLEGIPVHFHGYSSNRNTPFCSHFDLCGGCKWQNIQYDFQLHQKEKTVRDNFERLGKLQDFEVSPIIPSGRLTHYRNRLDFAFSNKRWLTTGEVDSGDEIKDRDGVGFHIPGRFDKVLDIEECHLQPEPSNQIRLALRKFARAKEFKFYDVIEHKGLLRSLIIRNTLAGDLMVITMFGEDQPEEIKETMDFLKATFPEITSLYYVINQKKNDTFFDLPMVHYSGNSYISEEINGISYRFGPKSFFQTNSNQAKTLFDLVHEFGNFSGDEIVYDLYTGVGSIALNIASGVKKVIGVETVPEAIEYAKENCEINGITNASFFTGEVEDVVTNEFINENGFPDVIIVDPPRNGMHKKAVEFMDSLGAEKIIYVSCNPATQARDLEMIKENYRIVKVRPVDMFPHTPHVENVVLLEKILK